MKFRRGIMNDFIAYLNSTNNIGGNSTGSLAETQVKSPFYDYVKIDRRIGTRITKEIEAEEYKTYILTGHAGDGKTSILVQVLKTLGYLQQGEGLEVSHEYSQLFYVKDMSEIPEQKQVELLEKALVAPKNKRTGILVSNTGPLLNAFTILAEIKKRDIGESLSDKEKIELQSLILTQLDKNEDKEIEVAGHRFILVNIARVDNVSFASKILHKIINPSLWESCEKCGCKGKCPIYNNYHLLTNQYDRISEFIDNYYRFLYENDKRMTIRQMVGQLSYGITGNLSCEKVANAMLKEPLFNYNFANLFFGFKGIKVNKDSLQIKGIEYIQNLGLDKKALEVDYRLFVNNDFSFFMPEVRNIVTDVAQKSRKHFQIAEDNMEQFSSIQAQTALVRRAIRRFYLIYGLDTDEFPIKNLYNQIYGVNFIDYKKMITSVQSSAMTRKIQNVVYNALYIKNTGFLPASSTEIILPLTLRREDEVYQSVLLVLGEVNKSDIKIVTKKVCNELEDADEKYEMYIQLKDAYFKLSLPMMNYFNNLIAGAVTSNSNPALSHGIAALDTLLLEQFGDVNVSSGDECEISVIVNTTHGQRIKRFEFDGKHLQLVD